MVQLKKKERDNILHVKGIKFFYLNFKNKPEIPALGGG